MNKSRTGHSEIRIPVRLSIVVFRFFLKYQKVYKFCVQ